MCKFAVVYDQEGGYEGTNLIAKLFADGWEYLQPLRYVNGLYRAIFYWPGAEIQQQDNHL